MGKGLPPTCSRAGCAPRTEEREAEREAATHCCAAEPGLACGGQRESRGLKHLASSWSRRWRLSGCGLARQESCLPETPRAEPSSADQQLAMERGASEFQDAHHTRTRGKEPPSPCEEREWVGLPQPPAPVQERKILLSSSGEQHCHFEQVGFTSMEGPPGHGHCPRTPAPGLSPEKVLAKAELES